MKKMFTANRSHLMPVGNLPRFRVALKTRARVWKRSGLEKAWPSFWLILCGNSDGAYGVRLGRRRRTRLWQRTYRARATVEALRSSGYECDCAYTAHPNLPRALK